MTSYEITDPTFEICDARSDDQGRRRVGLIPQFHRGSLDADTVERYDDFVELSWVEYTTGGLRVLADLLTASETVGDRGVGDTITFYELILCNVQWAIAQFEPMFETLHKALVPLVENLGDAFSPLKDFDTTFYRGFASGSSCPGKESELE
jgi:hypothetical protein